MNAGNIFKSIPEDIATEVFEPIVQSGHRLAPLGFSAQSEHAHRNQGRLPF